MAAPLTAAERREKADRAVELSAKGWTNRRIAEELEVNPNTAAKLIKDELANRAEHREQEKEKAIAVYETIIAEGWRRLEELKDSRSHNASGFLNSIKAAQDSINKITGAEAPRKFQRSSDPPSRTEEEAAELADEIAAIEAELRKEAEVSGPEEGGA